MRFDLLPFVEYEVHVRHGDDTEHHLVGPGSVSVVRLIVNYKATSSDPMTER